MSEKIEKIKKDFKIEGGKFGLGIFTPEMEKELKWLIEQAEKVEEYQKTIESMANRRGNKMKINLRTEMMKQSKTREDLAKLLNIAISSVNNKMTGRADFKMREAMKIKNQWFPGLSLEYLFADQEENRDDHTEI